MKRALMRAMSLLELAANDTMCDQYGKDALVSAAHNIIAQTLDLAPVIQGDLILQLSDATINLLQRIEHDAEVDLACRDRLMLFGADYSTRLH